MSRQINDNDLEEDDYKYVWDCVREILGLPPLYSAIDTSPGVWKEDIEMSGVLNSLKKDNV